MLIHCRGNVASLCADPSSVCRQKLFTKVSKAVSSQPLAHVQQLCTAGTIAVCDHVFLLDRHLPDTQEDFFLPAGNKREVIGNEMIRQRGGNSVYFNSRDLLQLQV